MFTRIPVLFIFEIHSLIPRERGHHQTERSGQSAFPDHYCDFNLGSQSYHMDREHTDTLHESSQISSVVRNHETFTMQMSSPWATPELTSLSVNLFRPHIMQRQSHQREFSDHIPFPDTHRTSGQNSFHMQRTSHASRDDFDHLHVPGQENHGNGNLESPTLQTSFPQPSPSLSQCHIGQQRRRKREGRSRISLTNTHPVTGFQGRKPQLYGLTTDWSKFREPAHCWN